MENKVYWEDKKRIFGLPISFTRYQVTEDQLVIKTGFLNLRTETIKFFRVTDMSLMQPLTQRIFGVGTIHICSSDSRQPEFYIQCVKKPEQVHALIDKAVEQARKKYRTRTTEFIDGADLEMDEHF